jgi:ABC-type transport system involved in multi-copper enzyme maturation permease subunit
MERIVLVVGNAFRGILHARSLYLWIIAILVVGIQLAPQIIFRDAPPNLAGIARRQPLPQGLSAEETKRIEELQKKQQDAQIRQFEAQFRRNRPRALANGLNLWSMLSIGFAILLGANVFSNEVAAKTIITVLARPISRWELLLGKWLSIQIFGVMSIAVGVGIHLAAGAYLDIQFSSILWLALLHTMVAIMLYSAIALLLGTVAGSAVAGGATLVVAFLPGFVTFLKSDTVQWRHLIGIVLNYIVPPGFQNVITNSVDATMSLDRSALSKTLIENLLYCGIYFILACIIFSRREVRLG